MPLSAHYTFAQRAYKYFVLSCAFGCVVFPVFLTLFSAVLLPLPAFLCLVGFELVLAVIPLGEAPLLSLKSIVAGACHTCIEWLSIKVVHDIEKFSAPGPYVIGEIQPLPVRDMLALGSSCFWLSSLGLRPKIQPTHEFKATSVSSFHSGFSCRVGAALCFARGNTSNHEHTFRAPTGAVQ